MPVTARDPGKAWSEMHERIKACTHITTSGAPFNTYQSRKSVNFALSQLHLTICNPTLDVRAARDKLSVMRLYLLHSVCSSHSHAVRMILRTSLAAHTLCTRAGSSPGLWAKDAGSWGVFALRHRNTDSSSLGVGVGWSLLHSSSCGCSPHHQINTSTQRVFVSS